MGYTTCILNRAMTLVMHKASGFLPIGRIFAAQKACAACKVMYGTCSLAGGRNIGNTGE
jgi:hypothetical protein